MDRTQRTRDREVAAGTGVALGTGVPSFSHEAPLVLFRECPELAVRVLRELLGLDVPTGAPIVDELVRDDPRYEDAILFDADLHGITEGRGCLSDGFGGDGTFPAWTHRSGDVADFVIVDFTRSSTAEFHEKARGMLRKKGR